MTNIGKLIIFSGLPGSGKSTLAKELARKINGVYLRIDTIEQGLKEVCGITKLDGKGYEMAYRLAQENLILGNTVIADSVNPWKLTRDDWNKVATDVNAEFVNVEITCSDKSEHKKRVEGRGPSVPGMKLPTWEDVQQRDYHEWHIDRIQLDSAKKTIEECLSELILKLAITL